ncbi:MAG TPA: hypothetical protein VGF20_14845 [Candidatus Acidoferrum sp.]|jgi:hypothetical protein
MSGVWGLLEFVSCLLERHEREAVLGDLVEAQAHPLDALFAVIGLVVRRQTLLWKSWRPWMAGFGVALPSSFLLMGVSLSVSWSYMRLLCPDLLRSAELTRGTGTIVLFWQAVLLIGWAWTGGFVIGTTSKGTVWASSLLCYAPCLFCLSRYRVAGLSRYCLLLFLLPAIWGVVQGIRLSKMKLNSALILALAVTALMIPVWSVGTAHWWSTPTLTLNWVLSLPAWYLVATAQKPIGLKARTNG